jgi:Uma2 family endonuclease
MYQSQFPRPPSETLPTMYDLPSEDSEDMGLPDEFHDFQPDLLRETCQPIVDAASNFFVGVDLNLYYDLRHTQWYKRPDWFLCLGVARADRQEQLRLSYVIWQEGVTPLVIVEMLSPGTEDDDLGGRVRELGKSPTKWEVYERILRVPFYVVYDRYINQLRVFTLSGVRYQEVELNSENPRFWIEELGLGLGLWSGKYEGAEGKWLRWYDAKEEWIPTAMEQAVMERAAKIEAESAKIEAESAKVRAESALTQAESARDVAQAKLAAAIPQLMSLGLTVEQIASSLGLTVERVNEELRMF